MVNLSPLRYPTLYAMLCESVDVKSEVTVEDNWFTFKFELGIRLPESIASIFD